ncbi:tRNA (guanosine(46)-N7)-methyltransferase TrmB [Candidatus Saccharibacteria bacterium]|nr:tRNA (guanosine(46)-N7)-methyltransferase TrmB [Candidatus Saccharibacteria bacterium]
MTDEIIKTLAQGGLVVMRSDTIYGIFASALNDQAVKKLHTVRKRDLGQGFIILVDSVETVARLIQISDKVRKRLTAIWRANASTSVILPATGLTEKWLADTHEVEPTVCFRVPNDANLKKLLTKTGALCAPSANLPNQPPARNVSEAKKYFGDQVDLYDDAGECDTVQPSRIIKLSPDGTIETVRSDGQSHPEDFVITRRRKLYKFARFDEYSNCFSFDEWVESRDDILSDCAIREALEDGESGSDEPCDDTREERSRITQSDSRQLIVEIGAGSALFSVELARRNPEKIFVAVDIKSDRLYQGARAAEKLDLKNIYFVRSDIAKITEVIPSHSASEIWLTFPYPWPPKSDARHRLTAPRYLAYYHQLLARTELAKESGVLHFKTDNSPLFEWSLEQFAASGWKAEFVTRDLHESPDAPADAKITTSYEERFIAEGSKINYTRFVSPE